MMHRKFVHHARIFTEVLGLALRVEAELRFCRFESVLERLERTRARGRVGRPMPVRTLEHATHAVYRVLPFESTCLKQSLIFCRAWRRRGQPAELRIGVQKEGDVFAAHAWVEDGAGNVLTDPREGFSPVTLPAIRGERAND